MKLQPEPVAPGQLLPTPKSSLPLLFSLLTLPSSIQVGPNDFEPPSTIARRFVLGLVSPPLPGPPVR